ncbi:unnamed protein product, partial [Brenthis ino]
MFRNLFQETNEKSRSYVWRYGLAVRKLEAVHEIAIYENSPIRALNQLFDIRVTITGAVRRRATRCAPRLRAPSCSPASRHFYRSGGPTAPAAGPALPRDVPPARPGARGAARGGGHSRRRRRAAGRHSLAPAADQRARTRALARTIS